MESAMVCNSDPEEAWAVSGETDVEKMHAFRHGAAETSNLYIEKARQMDARITKLGTDMTISGTPFSDILSYVEKELHDAGLKGSVFGLSLIHICLQINYNNLVVIWRCSRPICYECNKKREK